MYIYIYIYVHALQGKVFEFPTLEWNTFFEMFEKKQLFEGDWFDMHDSWMPHLKDDNLLWLDNPFKCNVNNN